MTDKKQFPILGHAKIKSIDWDAVEPHREWAQKNHYQTLEGLASRGGLSLDELVAIMAGRHWGGLFKMKDRANR